MFFKKLGFETTQTTINVLSAHGLWRLLGNRYYIINELRIFGNFVHDMDFRHIITCHIHSYEKEVEVLVSLLNLYSIPGPTPAVAGSNTTGNSQVITDRQIGQLMLRFTQEDICAILDTVRGTTTSDEILKKFIDMAVESFSKLEDLIFYLKLKGWIDLPPLYPYIPPKLNEKVAANEIYLLFDHLIFRYNSTHYTKLMAEYVDDLDFKAVLTAGIVILERQTSELEDVLNRYGVFLPLRYSSVVPRPEDTQIIEDRLIYNEVLDGIRNACTLHALALKEIIVNDRLRGFFLKLTKQELKLFRNIVRYGKVKGWINTIPLYRFGPK